MEIEFPKVKFHINHNFKSYVYAYNFLLHKHYINWMPIDIFNYGVHCDALTVYNWYIINRANQWNDNVFLEGRYLKCTFLVITILLGTTVDYCHPAVQLI